MNVMCVCPSVSVSQCECVTGCVTVCVPVCPCQPHCVCLTVGATVFVSLWVCVQRKYQPRKEIVKKGQERSKEEEKAEIAEVSASIGVPSWQVRTTIDLLLT